MELRQLRYFLAVADELHFRRAAERLHMSQPPLSSQIQALERELGLTLLARSRRHVELTIAGRAFRDHTRALLRELDAAVSNARRLDAGLAGRLRISFVGSALSVVPPLVQRFRAERPEVEIELREQPTEKQIEAVRSGAVDLGLVPLPIEADGLSAQVLLRERTVAALPAGHALAAFKRIPLGRLAAEPFVFFPRDQAPGLHDRLLGALGDTGNPPQVVQTAAETQTIIGLVAAGIGVSLVQASVQRLALPGVSYRPVSPAPTVELAAIGPGEPPPAAQAFLSLAKRRH